MSAAEQSHLDEVSPSYWRVTFDNGPVNLLDPDTIGQLGALIGRIENDPDLTVVVFRSDKPGYFMAHWDFLAGNARVAGMPSGPTGLHPYADNFVRLSRVPVATIAETRGRARGAGSEFVLATDIRFASEKAVLGQFEVGAGAVPGGGPMVRLGRLAGRGRYPHCGALLFDPGHLPASPEDRENWWLGVTRQQVRRAASAAQAARPPEGSGTILALMHASCHRSARAAERRNPALHPKLLCQELTEDCAASLPGCRPAR